MSFFGLARGARTPAGSPFRGVSSSPNAIDLRGRWVGGRRRMVSSSRKRRLPASDAATQTTNSSRSRSSSGMWRGFRRHRTLLGSSAALALTGAAIVWLRETHILPKEFYDRNDMGVDWDEVYHLGKLSNMTSSPREEVEGWLYLHGYRGKVTQRELQLHKVKYFIFKGSDREGKPLQLLLVRGTVNFSNLKSCTKALKAWDEQTGCNLHAGFKGVADALVADALPLLDRELPLKLAGHSSGGGVCIIVGMKLATLDYKVARVMTFGSPKVTDQMGAKRWGGAHDSRDGVSSTEAGEELDSCGGAAGDRGDASNASAGLQLPVIRVTHENDVIPLLPSAASTTSKAPAVEGTSGPTIEPSLPRPRGGRFSHFGHQVVLLNGKVQSVWSAEESSTRSSAEVAARGKPPATPHVTTPKLRPTRTTTPTERVNTVTSTCGSCAFPCETSSTACTTTSTRLRSEQWVCWEGASCRGRASRARPSPLLQGLGGLARRWRSRTEARSVCHVMARARCRCGWPELSSSKCSAAYTSVCWE